MSYLAVILAILAVNLPIKQLFLLFSSYVSYLADNLAI